MVPALTEVTGWQKDAAFTADAPPPLQGLMITTARSNWADVMGGKESVSTRCSPECKDGRSCGVMKGLDGLFRLSFAFLGQNSVVMCEVPSRSSDEAAEETFAVKSHAPFLGESAIPEVQQEGEPIHPSFGLVASPSREPTMDDASAWCGTGQVGEGIDFSDGDLPVHHPSADDVPATRTYHLPSVGASPCLRRQQQIGLAPAAATEAVAPQAPVAVDKCSRLSPQKDSPPPPLGAIDATLTPDAPPVLQAVPRQILRELDQLRRENQELKLMTQLEQLRRENQELLIKMTRSAPTSPGRQSEAGRKQVKPVLVGLPIAAAHEAPDFPTCWAEVAQREDKTTDCETSTVSPLETNSQSPLETNSQLESPRSQQPNAISFRCLKLTGFSTAAMNTVYIERPEPRHAIAGRETYCAVSNQHFLFFCSSTNTWAIEKMRRFCHAQTGASAGIALAPAGFDVAVQSAADRDGWLHWSRASSQWEPLLGAGVEMRGKARKASTPMTPADNLSVASTVGR